MQNKYMSVNQFLDMLFTASEHKDKFVRYFANVVNNVSVADRGGINYIQNWMQSADLSNELRTLFEQYVAAKQDQSPEAQDFLNMAETLTFFSTDAYNDKYKDPEFKALNILKLIQNNVIKNPMYSYKLLKQIPEMSVSSATLKNIRLAIAQNQNATAADAAEYAKWSKSPEEIRKLINDFMVKIEQNLAPELNKEILNEQRINSILGDTNSLGNMIAYLSDLTRNNPEQFAKTRELAKMLDNKFDKNKILNVQNGNYIQQYKDQAELQLAEIKPEMAKMRQDLDNAKIFDKQYEDELTKLREENQRLKGELQNKDAALQNSENKYNMLKGQVNLYIRDVKERANGSMFGKGKDLADLAIQLQSQINQSK